MELIKDWQKKKLKCKICGIDKSVKYRVYGREICNSCALENIKE